MAEEKNLDIEETPEVTETENTAEVTEEAVEETAASETAAEEPVRQKSANIKQQGDDEPHILATKRKSRRIL